MEKSGPFSLFRSKLISHTVIHAGGLEPGFVISRMPIVGVSGEVRSANCEEILSDLIRHSDQHYLSGIMAADCGVTVSAMAMFGGVL